MSDFGRRAGTRWAGSGSGKPSAPVRRRSACPWGEHVWREQRAPDRVGWWRGWCDVCGKFLGYRQGEAPRQPRESHPGGVFLVAKAK